LTPALALPRIAIKGGGQAMRFLERSWRQKKKLHTQLETTPDDASPRKPRKKLSYWYLIAASAALSVLAGLAKHVNMLHIAGTLLIIALGLSSFLLRKSGRRDSLIMTVVILLLFAGELGVVIVIVIETVSGRFFTTDPEDLILIMALGLCGFGAALCVAATWISGWPYTEAVAMGIVALALGALCLPGLRIFTRSLNPPQVNGAALLFATGSANQRLALNVTVPDSDPNVIGAENLDNIEDFTIQSASIPPIHWALLIVGDAHLSEFPNTLPQSINLQIFRDTESLYPSDVQLFSGTVDRSSPVSIAGISAGKFINETVDRAAISLPDYGQGYASTYCSNTRLSASTLSSCSLGEVDQITLASITKALDGKPLVRPLDDFSVVVSSGELIQSETVTQSDLSLAPNSATTNNLQWSGHGDISIQYDTAARTVASDTNNVLFVFAILLGVAGAGLLGCLQTTIHILSDRKPTGNQQHPAQALNRAGEPGPDSQAPASQGRGQDTRPAGG
jgi:hypothetical protein